MERQSLIDAVASGMKANEAVRGLFLGGSLGRGTADEWSDIDFVAVAALADHQTVATVWRGLLERITPIVFWNQIDGERMVLNVISEDWLRCDLAIQTPESLAGRAQDLLVPLFDRDGIYDTLPASLPPKEPNPGYVRYVIHEFIRMLGLLPVVAGRGELVTMALGLGMMRDHMAGLLMQDVTEPDPGGILHQSKILPPQAMDLLRSLPYPPLQRDALIAANIEIARHFMPRARHLADRLDIAWPSRFEAATRQHLQATLGLSTLW